MQCNAIRAGKNFKRRVLDNNFFTNFFLCTWNYTFSSSTAQLSFVIGMDTTFIYELLVCIHTDTNNH